MWLIFPSQDQSRTYSYSLQHTFIQHLMKKMAKPEKNLEKVEEWVEEIYAVLAMMPWSSQGSGGQFEALCEVLWAAKDGPLSEERILNSLLRPQCDALVSMFCSTAIRLQRDHLLRNMPNTQGRNKFNLKMRVWLLYSESQIQRSLCETVVFPQIISPSELFLVVILTFVLKYWYGQNTLIFSPLYLVLKGKQYHHPFPLSSNYTSAFVVENMAHITDTNVHTTACLSCLYRLPLIYLRFISAFLLTTSNTFKQHCAFCCCCCCISVFCSLPSWPPWSWEAVPQFILPQRPSICLEDGLFWVP